jgi:hypothetical protein
LFRETLETAIGLMAIPEMKNFTFDDRDGIARLCTGFGRAGGAAGYPAGDADGVPEAIAGERPDLRDDREIVTSIFEAVGLRGERRAGPGIRHGHGFFTGVMPLLSYVGYHEGWMERFGVAEADLRSRSSPPSSALTSISRRRPIPGRCRWRISPSVIRGDKELNMGFVGPVFQVDWIGFF